LLIDFYQANKAKGESGWNFAYKVEMLIFNSNCNLIYVDSSNELLFKIVIQPNYSSKLGNINAIVTAGIVYEDTLKSKYYEEIQNMDGN